MRKYLTILVIGLTTLELSYLFDSEPFKSSISTTYAAIQCKDQLNTHQEIISCSNGKKYKKTKTNLIAIE